ncbi:MAG TPA: DUF4157 domain-containing protein [Pyrinomonadaceae bacterium]
MRDFINRQQDADEHDASHDAPAKMKTRHTDAPKHASAPEVGASETHAEMLASEPFSHPANAEPLAEMLGQLQHVHGNAYVQRVVAGIREAKGEAETVDAKADKVQSLDTGTRVGMEAAFGEDFGNVRVHTGGYAEEKTDELGAQAFTRGEDIYFAKDAHDASTEKGRETLAHELAHVAQQQRGRAQERSNPNSTREAAEDEAERVAKLVVAGHRAEVEHSADASAIYMQRRQQPNQPQRTPVDPAAVQAAYNAPFTVTSEMYDAARQFLTNPRFETQQIAIYVAPSSAQAMLMMNYLKHADPHIWQEIISQVPPNADTNAFLTRFAGYIWVAVSDDFFDYVRRRYNTDRAFQQRVDRARGRSAGHSTQP